MKYPILISEGELVSTIDKGSSVEEFNIAVWESVMKRYRNNVEKQVLNALKSEKLGNKNYIRFKLTVHMQEVPDADQDN